MRRLALSVAVSLTAVLAAGAASAQSIRVGQTVNGTISSSDPTVDDGSNYDCWVFTAPAGNYTVDYRSEDFDPFLVVGKGSNCGAEGQAFNDDWSGLDSHIEFASDGGPWFIKTNTVTAGESGAYTLSLVAGGDPTAADRAEEDTDGLDLAWMDDIEGRAGGEDYLMDVLCAAVDTLDMIVTMDSMTEDQLEARIMDGGRFTERATRSGAGLGYSSDDVENHIANLGAVLLMDPEQSGDYSGARQECLARL